jgi:hypothetical protein
VNTRKTIVLSAVAAALAAGGVGAAIAIGGDDESVTGPDADKAAAAAVKAVPGTVSEVEHDDSGSGAYEVEVQRDDGSEVEVHLDSNYEVIATGGDDSGGDEGSGEDDD